jgi:hypothetical protein
MKRKRNFKNVKSENDKDIISLNERCFDEFVIIQLEERLETDPLALVNMLNIGLSSDMDAESMGCPCTEDCGCNKIKKCPMLECGTKVCSEN